MGKGKKKIVPNGQGGHGRATIGLPSNKNQEKMNQMAAQAIANKKSIGKILPVVREISKPRYMVWKPKPIFVYDSNVKKQLCLLVKVGNMSVMVMENMLRLLPVQIL